METSESKKTGVHTVNDGKMAEIVKLDKRFGRIAIKNKLLTIEQVKDALRKQDYIYKKSNYIVLIGDLLVDSGAMNVRYRDAILKRQNRLITDKKKRKSFGEIAVEKGFITPEQLESALKYQAEKYSERRNVIFLGDVLLEQELISEEQRDIVAKEREVYRESTQAKTEIISPKEVSEPDTKAQMPKTPDQDETPEAETKTDKTSRQDEAAETKSQADKTPDQDEANKTAAPQPNKTPDQDEPIKISPQPDPTPDQDESSKTAPQPPAQTPDQDEASKTTPQTDEPPEQDEIDDVSEQTAHKTEIVEEEEEEEEETGEPYTDLNLEENLQISMTEDKLEAFIKVKAMLPIRTRLLDLKHYIESSGIVHGLVTNKSLKEWIKNKKKRRRPFKIAQGTNPEPPKDARVVFHFETDPKKKGTEKKDGSIDYKNRGETISIKQGALLAEIIPPEEGKPGLDVTGKVIDVAKPKNAVLKTGKGVQRSPDGLKIFAGVNGMPELDQSSKINVHQVLTINGDVGMQTGHIFFDGIVHVKGEVCPGFQVKAEKLETSAIMNAEVNTTGDVLVSGGIVGAKIKANGVVKSKFMKAAQITTKNDVQVEKEIVDSNINVGGKCLCERGKIVASQITAAQGVRAAEIGSDYSASCHIMVGVSSKVQKQLKRLKNTLEHCKRDEQADVKAEISRIKARELSGVADATADIVAAKGIIGAEIQTRGKVVAGYLKNVVIESLGHVVVQKEIMKSKVQSGGEINVQNGKILISNLVALGNITALEVGTEVSGPSKLSFGVNEAVKERLASFNKSLEDKQKDLEQSKPLLESYHQKFKTFETNAQDISWIKQYTKKLSGPMRRKLDSLDQVPPQNRMLKIKEYMGSMDSKMKASDYTKEFRNLQHIQEYMEKYFGRHEKMRTQITNLETKVKDLGTEIKTLQSDIRALSSTAITNPSAYIRINGRIYSRTDLQSANAAMLLTQDFGPCKITEDASKIVIQKTGATPPQTPSKATSPKTDTTKKPESQKKDVKKVTVYGRVVASVGGMAASGVPNVSVAMKGWREEKQVHTDNNGDFVIPLLKPGKYTLTIQSKNRPVLVQKLKLKDQKKMDLGELVLKAK